MKSNYKILGNYIKEVDCRDTDKKVNLLLGVSIQKRFIPSIANTIGTDMSTYKIIRKDQFAYGPVTSRNGDKISIALLNEADEAIVSQAYFSFEIRNKKELLPEYLMMWFRRPEFDRFARFKSHGSAREIFSWEDMCNVELPLPHPDKQREIINEYNTIVDRIELNNQLIKKLEETAQTLYKQWFFDFEFPDENGKPYKSNGGEMNESELGLIPKNWEVGILNGFVTKWISHRGKSKSIMNLQPKNKYFKYPVLTAMNISRGNIVKHATITYADVSTFEEWMNEPLQTDDVIMTSEAPLGELYFVAKRTEFIISQRLYAIRVNKEKLSGLYLYYWLQSPIAKDDLKSRATGTTVSGIKLSELKKLTILKPKYDLVELFSLKMKPLMNFNEEKKVENEILHELKNILLSKLATIED